MTAPCRISFVVTTRNDDFGGEMIRRLRLFIDNLSRQADRHRLSSEIIVVEWNPPDGPRLHDTLDVATKSEHLAVRFVEVPPEIHTGIENASRLPLFQMIAKNVGIRRARGEFVVATNQDILFSDGLVRFLARETLEPGVLYRIDRTDVAAEVPEAQPLDETEAWCERHVLRIHTRLGTLAWAPWWNLHWVRHHGLHELRRMVRGASFARFTARLGAVVRDAARGATSLVRRAAAQLLKVRLGGAPPKVHTNACGDFTLLSRDDWFRLRGYAEVPLYSLHIDSLFCYSAIAAGCRQRVLGGDIRVFHLEHESSWATMDAEERVRWFATRPWLEWGIVDDLWHDLWRRREPFHYNDEGWGFAGHAFREVVWQGGAVRHDAGVPPTPTRTDPTEVSNP